MYFVYILRSKSNPNKTYIGYTSALEKRLSEHNSGISRYTNMFMPWEIEIYVSFRDKAKAMSFERYLKTGSGVAFASKHFLH